jgi:hypothetical protein
MGCCVSNHYQDKPNEKTRLRRSSISSCSSCEDVVPITLPKQKNKVFANSSIHDYDASGESSGLPQDVKQIIFDFLFVLMPSEWAQFNEIREHKTQDAKEITVKSQDIPWIDNNPELFVWVCNYSNSNNYYDIPYHHSYLFATAGRILSQNYVFLGCTFKKNFSKNFKIEWANIFVT